MVNNDYIGDSPVTFTFKFRGPYFLSSNPWETAILDVEAYPRREMMDEGIASGEVQRRRLVLERPDQTPSRLFFDMMMEAPSAAPLVNIENTATSSSESAPKAP